MPEHNREQVEAQWHCRLSGLVSFSAPQLGQMKDIRMVWRNRYECGIGKRFMELNGAIALFWP